MSEHRAITTLLPRVATGTLLILLVGFVTNNNVTGSLNKPMYLGILVLGFALTAIFLYTQRSTWLDSVLAILASVGLVWGIWTIERTWLIGPFWEGFGESVAIGVLVMLLVLGPLVPPPGLSILRSPVLTRWAYLGLGLIVVVCCACDLLALIRTFDFMAIVSNNVNEVNDVLGPAAGNTPDAAFIPQYTALYGWLFVPLDHLLSPNALVGTIAIFFSLLDVVCVVLAVWITRRALGTRGYVLAIAFVVPMTFVTSSAGDISSIASLFQELPIRLLSGFIIAALGLHDLVLLYRGTLRIKNVLLVGVVCGLVAWNSQDFGVAAAGVYGLMILLGATHGVRWRALGIWIAGLLIGAVSYPLFVLAIGSPLDLGFVGAFIKLFATGFGSVPIQVPGPVLVVMPIVVCSAAVGWALLRIRHRAGARADAVLDRAMITLAFVGTWSALCMVYYVNRAFAAGQLQTMLLPCGVCIAALFSILVHTDAFALPAQGSRARTLLAVMSHRAALLPIGVFVSLCLASALLTPTPIAAATNLVDPSPVNGYANFGFPQLISAVRLAQTYTSGRPGELTYLGESFNYISLVTHVQSSSLFFPEVSPEITQIQCQYLQSHHSQWMILSPYSVHSYGTGACGIYKPVALPGLIIGQLQELK